MASLPRQKSQFWKFMETWQICVNSYKEHTYLATEVVQVKNGHSPEIMKEIFVFQENKTYNLKSGNHLVQRNIWTTQYRIKVFQTWELEYGICCQGKEIMFLLFCF